jgi:hypothetical protein
VQVAATPIASGLAGAVRRRPALRIIARCAAWLGSVPPTSCCPESCKQLWLALARCPALLGNARCPVGQQHARVTGT